METEGSLPHSHQSPLLSTLSHINQVHILPTDFLKTHFNIIPSRTRRSSKSPLSLRIPHKITKLTSPLLHTCYMFRPSHSCCLTTLMIFGEAYKQWISSLGIIIIIIVVNYSSVLLYFWELITKVEILSMLMGQCRLSGDQDKGGTTKEMEGCVSTLPCSPELGPTHPPVQSVLWDFSWG
jgi:hypothetical protein